MTPERFLTVLVITLAAAFPAVARPLAVHQRDAKLAARVGLVSNASRAWRGTLRVDLAQNAQLVIKPRQRKLSIALQTTW